MEKHFGYMYRKKVWYWWVYGGLVGTPLLFSGLWFLREHFTKSYTPWWVVLVPCLVLVFAWVCASKVGWIAGRSIKDTDGE